MKLLKTIAKLVVPLMVLASAAAGFMHLRSTRPQATPSPVQEKVRPVSAVEARLSDEQPMITEFGSVVAGSVVELRPLVSGQIVELGSNFLEGAIVQKGERLVFIDRFDYEVDVLDKKGAIAEARARLRETRAELRMEGQLLAIAKEQLALRMANLERKRKLNARGTLSRKARDDALISYNEAKSTVESYKQKSQRLTARLDQLKASVARSDAALKRASHDLTETVLVAPEAGYLADATAAIGQRVGVNDRLARLIVANRLEVSLQLKLNEFGRLVGGSGRAAVQELIGRNVIVLWRVGQKAFTFQAVIERLGAEFDPSTGGVGVFARLIDANAQMLLRPGAFVEVKIPGRIYRNVLRLPLSAVDADGNVYVIEQGRLVPQRAQVLRRVGKDVLVRAGIAPGAKIVTTRFPEIGPGIRVELR